MHEQPGATPTGATVDAMEVLGHDFDGQWYPGFDDYFVKRFGPEAEGPTFWWGILVNGAFTPVGGCQFALAAGDRVLWVNDAFSGRPFLSLTVPSAGPRPTVAVGQPLTVAVTGLDADQASGPPYEGATVGAVTERGTPAPAAVATAGRSGADGAATVTFHAAGWQRLKARTVSADPQVSPAAIASDSVDVCVEPTGGAGCAGAPPSAWPINVARPDPQPEPQQSDPQPQPQPQPRTDPQLQPQPVPVPEPVVGGDGGATARWRVAQGSAGIRAWRGVRVPIDDRARAISRRGRWTAVRDGGAWKQTLSRGRAGASLRVTLGAGRPVVLLRGGTAAKLRLRAGGTVRTVTLRSGGARIARTLLGPARAAAGQVELRVLRGTVSVDGVGVKP